VITFAPGGATLTEMMVGLSLFLFREPPPQPERTQAKPKMVIARDLVVLSCIDEQVSGAIMFHLRSPPGPEEARKHRLVLKTAR
jgi:hypothetical protein